MHLQMIKSSAPPSHPFYSPVKGWTDACKLRAGDILVLVNGDYVVVEKIQHEILESPVKVYNFQVEDYHTYYVASGVLVHNKCVPTNASPDGAGRHGALNQAKRDYGIPTSQQPERVLPNVDRRGNVVPGRVYDYGNGRFIRDDVVGHLFPDGGYLPRHFNGKMECIISTNAGHWLKLAANRGYRPAITYMRMHIF